MLTKVELDDELAVEASRFATQTGRTLAVLIEEGLRLVVPLRQPRGPAERVELVTGGEGGLMPGIKKDDFNHL